MEWIRIINYIITIIFLLCYSYQFIYIPISWFKKNRKPAPQPRMEHEYAALICARNEASVIGDLIDSLHRQTYAAEKLHIFVLADNCTDDTARIARKKGAVVYERFNRELVGKGYALSELLRYLKEDYPAGFDGYFVFDADNILAEDYVEQMDRTFSEGHDIITSYRNSKNYGDNWISAGYALWFLRESRYLNYARHLLGVSCAVSGTGFLFSRKVAEEIGEWPFHTLTEDIEFSIDQICKGKKIAYCKDAELFDEQPVKFSQSWWQRMRWSKGYLQVLRIYGGKLLKGAAHGSVSCMDVSMNIMPAYALSILSILCNVTLTVLGAVQGNDVQVVFWSVLQLLGNMYFTAFVVGMITTITEWKHIRASAYQKVLYSFTFPLFMMTYIPISAAALFCKVEWKPIVHSRSGITVYRRAKPLVNHEN